MTTKNEFIQYQKVQALKTARTLKGYSLNCVSSLTGIHTVVLASIEEGLLSMTHEQYFKVLSAIRCTPSQISS